MEDYCLGFEKLMDRRDCSLCKAKDLGNNRALAFFRYKDGYTKFDVVDTSNKLFFGKRVDQHMGFSTMNLYALQEALTMIQESSLYKNLLLELGIHTTKEHSTEKWLEDLNSSFSKGTVRYSISDDLIKFIIEYGDSCKSGWGYITFDKGHFPKNDTISLEDFVRRLNSGEKFSDVYNSLLVSNH